MATKRLRLISIPTLIILSFIYLFQTQQFITQTTLWRAFRNPSNVDWSRFAYTQYVTNSEYLCNSVMFFESLHRLSSRPDRVMMVPFGMLEPEMVNSSDAYLINKARDEYNVKIVPITIQTSWVVERE